MLVSHTTELTGTTNNFYMCSDFMKHKINEAMCTQKVINLNLSASNFKLNTVMWSLIESSSRLTLVGQIRGLLDLTHLGTSE